MVNDAVDLLVRQEALIQTLVQKVVVKHNDLVNRLHLLQIVTELVKVGFQHLK